MTAIDLDSPEVKAAIAAAVAEEVRGLKEKNHELLGEVKRLRKQSEIKPEDMEAVERERDELRTQHAESAKALKKAMADLEAARKRSEEVDQQYSRTLADGALTEALAKAGVSNPVHLKAAKAMLSSSISVIEENGARTVKAGDKALADFVKEWAGGDEGKHFVAAPNASGAGAGHTRPGSGANSIARPAFDALSPYEQAAHIKSGGQITD